MISIPLLTFLGVNCNSVSGMPFSGDRVGGRIVYDPAVFSSSGICKHADSKRRISVFLRIYELWLTINAIVVQPNFCSGISRAGLAADQGPTEADFPTLKTVQPTYSSIGGGKG
jgi:hypothetical protein